MIPHKSGSCNYTRLVNALLESVHQSDRLRRDGACHSGVLKQRATSVSPLDERPVSVYWSMSVLRRQVLVCRSVNVCRLRHRWEMDNIGSGHTRSFIRLRPRVIHREIGHILDDTCVIGKNGAMDFWSFSLIINRSPPVQIPCLQIDTGSTRAKLSYLSDRTCKLMHMTGGQQKPSPPGYTFCCWSGIWWWTSLFYTPRLDEYVSYSGTYNVNI